jgi:hypothetical protein
MSVKSAATKPPVQLSAVATRKRRLRKSESRASAFLARSGVNMA